MARCMLSANKDEPPECGPMARVEWSEEKGHYRVYLTPEGEALVETYLKACDYKPARYFKKIKPGLFSAYLRNPWLHDDIDSECCRSAFFSARKYDPAKKGRFFDYALTLTIRVCHKHITNYYQRQTRPKTFTEAVEDGSFWDMVSDLAADRESDEKLSDLKIVSDWVRQNADNPRVLNTKNRGLLRTLLDGGLLKQYDREQLRTALLRAIPKSLIDKGEGFGVKKSDEKAKR